MQYQKFWYQKHQIFCAMRVYFSQLLLEGTFNESLFFPLSRYGLHFSDFDLGCHWQRRFMLMAGWSDGQMDMKCIYHGGLYAQIQIYVADVAFHFSIGLYVGCRHGGDSCDLQAGRSFYDLNMAVLVQDEGWVAMACRDICCSEICFLQHVFMIVVERSSESWLWGAVAGQVCFCSAYQDAWLVWICWEMLSATFWFFFSAFHQPSDAASEFRNPFTQDANEVYGEAL